MSVRNLPALLKPRSIVLIGASRRPGSVGSVLARNLFRGGFEGPVMAVHPQAASVESSLAYRSVEDLPMTPDLAVIATPPASVPDLVDRLGRRGTKAAVVISAGFGEAGSDDDRATGKALMQRMLDAARPHLLRLLGPNCVGLLVPPLGLNASFVHRHPSPGSIAFLTQSGAMATSVIDWAAERGIGFSAVASLGDMADVDFGDLLDYYGGDPGTRAILLYIETVTDARKFLSAGRAAARTKPVIVIKTGRTRSAARAAASHTGALAGTDAVYDAAFRRAGMLRVFDLEELFAATATLSSRVKVTGDRLAILSNGGGIGVLATEALEEGGGRVANLAPETMARLDAALPATWSHGNPVDIIGDAGGPRYAQALEALMDDPGSDAVLVLNCPTAVADPIEAAEAVVDVVAEKRGRPVLTSWLGAEAAQAARRLFHDNRIPTFDTPSLAVRGFLHMVRYRRNQEQLMETPTAVPDAFTPDVAAARALIARVRAEGRQQLTEPEAKAVLAAYGIPVVRTVEVDTPAAAGAAAERLGGPLALKILSPEISHKTEVGGVRLDLATPEEVVTAAHAMLESVARLRPEATVRGFTVQEMVSGRGRVELILGIGTDRQFGPTLLFGQGGTAVEVVNDTVVALPPLNLSLARASMRRTRVYRLLEGYREQPPADIDAVALTLVKLSQIAVDLPEVAELDINPLLAGPDGVIALDARITVAEPAPGRRLAIRPMPQDLTRAITLGDGRVLTLRPVVPEDEPMIRRLVERSSPEDVRLRFFAPLRTLSHEMAARFSQIDYDREMALVAEGEDAQDGRAIFGVVRITADPDNIRAEYGIMVRSDMKGLGLGYQLMQAIIAYGAKRGLERIEGQVLRENTQMLRMARELGFTVVNDPDDPSLMDVAIALGESHVL